MLQRCFSPGADKHQDGTSQIWLAARKSWLCRAARASPQVRLLTRYPSAGETRWNSSAGWRGSPLLLLLAQQTVRFAPRTRSLSRARQHWRDFSYAEDFTAVEHLMVKHQNACNYAQMFFWTASESLKIIRKSVFPDPSEKCFLTALGTGHYYLKTATPPAFTSCLRAGYWCHFWFLTKNRAHFNSSFSVSLYSKFT